MSYAAAGGAIVGAIIGGEYNKASQQRMSEDNARAARITTAEQRAARKEAPDDAMAFFNKVAPGASESERLGVSGSAVGQAMSAPTQQAIARGNQRTQANQQQNQLRLQKSQLMQNGVISAADNLSKQRQMNIQDKIAERNSTTQSVNALVGQGYSIGQALDTSEVINKRAESKYLFQHKKSPVTASNIRSQKHHSVMAEAAQSLKEDAYSKQLLLPRNPWDLAMGLPYAHSRYRYSQEVVKRKNSKERKLP